ncbi:hypothetical protein HN51_050343 [Arachis hypogaea]
MDLHAFSELCAKSRVIGHVKDTIHVTIEETILFFFHRSEETIIIFMLIVLEPSIEHISESRLERTASDSKVLKSTLLGMIGSKF